MDYRAVGHGLYTGAAEPTSDTTSSGWWVVDVVGGLGVGNLSLYVQVPALKLGRAALHT